MTHNNPSLFGVRSKKLPLTSTVRFAYPTGPTVSNLFRNTGDICAPGSIHWGNIVSNFDNTVSHSGA